MFQRGAQRVSFNRFLRGVVLLVLALVLLVLVVGCPDDFFCSHASTLAGTVTLRDGTPLEGVEVTLFWPEGGGPLTFLTDTGGWYGYTWANCFQDRRITVTPSHPDYVFSPAEYDLPRVGDGSVDLDFVATPRG